MQQIVPIRQAEINGAEVNSVNARELWEALESKQRFTDWIKSRIEKYGFVEGEDFISFHKNMKREVGATSRVEYIITIDMAKELAMVENNEKGRQARRYFIEVEKRAKQNQKALAPEQFTMKAIASMAQEFLSFNEQVKEIKNDVEVLKNTSTIDYAQQRKIQKQVAIKVNELMINHNLPKDKSKKLYSGIYTVLKDKFNVGSYKDIPKVEFNNAMLIISQCSIKQAI